MNILSLISAVLISALSPINVAQIEGVKDGYAVIIEDQAIVAVIPEVCVGYEEKTNLLRSAAKIIGEDLGKDVILTEDMRTYLILSRIYRRGATSYERQNLALRLPKIKAYCYAIQKAG